GVEIIVVNDGDSTLEVPADLVNQIAYFENPGKGVSYARNFGVEKSSGELLFFIDDDMWINTNAIDWIRTYIFSQENKEAVYFLNWVYPEDLQESLSKSKIGRYLLDVNYHTLWGRLHKTGKAPVSGLQLFDFVGSCSLVISRKVFDKIGGYNKKMIFQGEDADLADKLNRITVPIYLVFDVTLQHNHADRLELDNFLKRIYDGFGSEYNALKAGIQLPLGHISYAGFKRHIFEMCRRTEKYWIILLNILPNGAAFTPINNRLIGALGGLQRYKQWKRIIE
ncbi:MAG: glycosyltransferase, partial [Ginsengibacter sp.]